jgi:hypothetical protein
VFRRSIVKTVICVTALGGGLAICSIDRSWAAAGFEQTNITCDRDDPHSSVAICAAAIARDELILKTLLASMKAGILDGATYASRQFMTEWKLSDDRALLRALKSRAAPERP